MMSRYPQLQYFEDYSRFGYKNASGIMMLLVCTLGFVGNIAGIITFGRPRLLQKNFYDFMFYLSIFDLVYVIVSLFVFVFPHFSNYYRDNGPLVYAIPWCIPIGQVSMTGSVYFTMAVTLERYFTVCQPFYMISRNQHSKKIASMIILFSITYNLPKFFESSAQFELCSYNQSHIGDLQTFVYSSNLCEIEIRGSSKRLQNVELDKHISHNVTHVTQVNSEDDLIDKHISYYRYYLHTSSMRLNSLYVQVYAVYMNFIFNGVGPFSLLIVLNILIVKDLQKSEQTRSSIGRIAGK